MASTIESEGPAAGEHNDGLFRWAISQNITVDGIKFVNIYGQGCGIAAKRNLKAGEQLFFVPSSSIMTLDSEDTFLTKYFELVRKASVQGQMAAKYMLKLMDESPQLCPWVSMLPSIAEMRKCMPVLWSEHAQGYLPPSSETLLIKQKEKLNADLAALNETFFSKLCMNGQYDKNYLVEMYKHSWALVYTRTFYWDYEYPSFTATLKDKNKYQPSPQLDTQGRERVYGRPREDCLAICPLIDFFNHSSDKENCKVVFTRKGFTITCYKDTEAEEELFVSYGNYGNDDLLVEYGFTLDSNPHDFITLDKEILPKLSKEQEVILRENDLLGNYTLNASGTCYRTQCVLRLHFLTTSQWQRFVKSEDDGVKEQAMVDEQVRNILDRVGDECDRNIARLAELAKPSAVSYNLSVPNGNQELMSIISRWKQISVMISSCKNRLVV